MCGITARVGVGDSSESLVATLENLEYRGYDSAGIAIKNGTGLKIQKREGKVAQLRNAVSENRIEGELGIGHTRWSTHGEPSDANAHPHVDCRGSIAVVHNGIIENHDALRRKLEADGHEFRSDTDTEVVPHLVEDALNDGEDPEAAFRAAIAELEGSYALAMLHEDVDAVFATRTGSPLVVGVGEDANYLASDVPAFLEYTKDVVYLEDGDVAVLTADDVDVTDTDGVDVTRDVETVDWAAEDAGKGEYDHFMLKEIHEQPKSLRQTLQGRLDDDGGVTLEGFPPGSFDSVARVHFVACGTSYHAGLYAESLFGDWNVDTQTFLASEYATHPPAIDDGTLVVGITQSGETADTLGALEIANEQGARTLALTNVVGSSAARLCDDSLFIRAGPEIGVAATKTFSSQVATLVVLGERIARDVTGSPTPDASARLEALADLPEHVDAVLENSSAGDVADRFAHEDSHFFIGRGSAFAVALEAALKFKEITYEHAEGFAAGELKHGPLALVTDRTPVFAVCNGNNEAKLESNVREVQTRDGPVVGVCPRTSDALADTADEVLTVPATHPDLVAILANVQLQLVAYNAADDLDRPIDKPRNLAKSVTVE
jgi:glucosamine--fructose-6-phosphate aminotransferase (isomerizing)